MKTIILLFCMVLAFNEFAFAKDKRKNEGFQKKDLGTNGMVQSNDDIDRMIHDTSAHIKSETGLNFTYEIDKAQFAEFYKNELKQEKVFDRVGSIPTTLCQPVHGYFYQSGMTKGSDYPLGHCKDDEACLKDLNAKFKKLVCGIKSGKDASQPEYSYNAGTVRITLIRDPYNAVSEPEPQDISKLLRKISPVLDKTQKSFEN